MRRGVGVLACGTVTSDARQPMEWDVASRARIAGEKEPVRESVSYLKPCARWGDDECAATMDSL
jgi:hypothetical protein